MSVDDGDDDNGDDEEKIKGWCGWCL